MPTRSAYTRLITYSMAAIRTLIAATILARASADRVAAIARTAWRQTHQARAKLSHYRGRGDPTHLLT